MLDILRARKAVNSSLIAMLSINGDKLQNFARLDVQRDNI